MKYFLAAFILIFAFGYWLREKPKHNPLNEAALLLTMNPPEVRATAPIVPVVEAISAIEASSPTTLGLKWKANLKFLENIDEMSQKDLDVLYQKAGSLIRANEAAVFMRIKKSYPKFLKNEMAESLFTIQSWIRYSSQPTQIVDFIFDFQPPADPLNLPTHHGQTKEERHRQLKAFSIRELREQLTAGNIQMPSSEESRLIAKFSAQAAQEKSLDVSLEVFEFLKAVRAEKEIQLALAQRSDYDRNLIQGVLYQ